MPSVPSEARQPDELARTASSDVSVSARLPVGRTAGEPDPRGDPDAAGSVRHTRLSATWTGLVSGLLVLVVLIVFIAQNTQRSTVHFFGLDGHAPTSVVLLIASVAGALVVVGVAMARLLQLRISAHRSEPGRTSPGRRRQRGESPTPPVTQAPSPPASGPREAED